jgi:hypothetical protein
MIIRPPQQGHGGRRSAAPAGISASECCAGGSLADTGTVISSLARVMLVLQVALASSP